MLFYEEKQFLRSNSLIWFAIVSLLITFFAVVLNFLNKGNDWIGILILSLVIGTILPLLILTSVHLRIEKDGIYIKYFPFHLKPLFLNWNDVDQFFLRRYNPLSEYGGWGLKGTKNNRAYNVSGNMGLQIFLKDGKKILVGTANPKKLEIALLEIRNQIKL